jgi:hypothetical protein
MSLETILVIIHDQKTNLFSFSFFRVDEMRYQMARQGWNQAPQMMMTPDQIKELVPIIDIEKANVKKLLLLLLLFVFYLCS